MRGFKLEINLYENRNIVNECIKDYNAYHRPNINFKDVHHRRRVLNQYLVDKYNVFIKFRKGTLSFKTEKDRSWFMLKWS